MADTNPYLTMPEPQRDQFIDDLYYIQAWNEWNANQLTPQAPKGDTGAPSPEQLAYDQYLWNVTDQDVQNMKAGFGGGQYGTVNPDTGMAEYKPMTPDTWKIYNDYQNWVTKQNSKPNLPGYTSAANVSNTSAGSTNWAGPNYPAPPGYTPETPVETPSAPSSAFAPAGKVDYSAQNSLENSLKKAARQNLNRNLEHGFRMAPKPATQKKSGPLSSFM